MIFSHLLAPCVTAIFRFWSAGQKSINSGILAHIPAIESTKSEGVDNEKAFTFSIEFAVGGELGAVRWEFLPGTITQYQRQFKQ